MLKASCFCATYGRPHLLEEAIESFLRQDYEGPKELIILNDFNGHRLQFDHPEVIVVNSDERILPLGRKFNLAAGMASGDVLFPWEDDDIYLPWRIRLSIEKLQNGIFHTRQAWLDDGNGLTYSENLYQCNLAITKERWARVGGYREADISGIDLDLYRRLEAEASCVALDPSALFYIYCWSTSGSYHGSAIGGMTDGISEAAETYVADEARRGRVPTGDVILKPHWRQDWSAQAKAASREASVEATEPRSPQTSVSLETYRPWHPGIEVEDCLLVPTTSRTGLVLLNQVARGVWQGRYFGINSAEIVDALSASTAVSAASIMQDVDALQRHWINVDLMIQPEYTRYIDKPVPLAISCDSPTLLAQFSEVTGASDEPLTWQHRLKVATQAGFFDVLADGIPVHERLYPDQALQCALAWVRQQSVSPGRLPVIQGTALQYKKTTLILIGESALCEAAAAVMLSTSGKLVSAGEVALTANGRLAAGSPWLNVDQSGFDAPGGDPSHLSQAPLSFNNGSLTRYVHHATTGSALKQVKIVFLTTGASTATELATETLTNRLLSVTKFGDSIQDKALGLWARLIGTAQGYEVTAADAKALSRRLETL